MLNSTSLKLSAVALGLMFLVGCQGQSTKPTAVGANAQENTTASAERAPTRAEQHAEDTMITVHLAQLKAGPELLVVDLGEDKKLYALPHPVLNRADMEGVTAVTSQEGETFLVFDMTEQGSKKLAEITGKAQGHFFLFGAAGQMIGISGISEPMTDGKLVMATQDQKHTEQVMQLLR